MTTGGPLDIDVTTLTPGQRLGWQCLQCVTGLTREDRIYIGSAGRPQRHLYVCAEYPRCRPAVTP